MYKQHLSGKLETSILSEDWINSFASEALRYTSLPTAFLGLFQGVVRKGITNKILEELRNVQLLYFGGRYKMCCHDKKMLFFPGKRSLWGLAMGRFREKELRT